MPEATQRHVCNDDFEKALRLTEAAGHLVISVQSSNVIGVQTALNTMAEDLIAFAKELIKTPAPEPEPPLA